MAFVLKAARWLLNLQASYPSSKREEMEEERIRNVKVLKGTPSKSDFFLESFVTTSSGQNWVLQLSPGTRDSGMVNVVDLQVFT